MNGWMIPVVAAAFTSCAFGFLYHHTNGLNLFVVSLGGALNWAIYLLAVDMTGRKILSFFVATAAAALFAEILARIIKAPVITLIVPMLIPMVPGGDLYYTTFALVRGQMVTFSNNGVQLIMEVGAMSLGLIVATCFMQTFMRISSTLRTTGSHNGVRPQ